MRIDRIHITAFGKLKDVTLELGKGLNILYGPNEAGKSTVLAFLQMLFYGSPGRTSDPSRNLRKKYAPFSGEKMAGSVDFFAQGAHWRLERSFGATTAGDRTALWNLDDGKEVPLPAKTSPGDRFFGFGAVAAGRAILIGQLSDMPADPDGEISGRLSNLMQSGEETVSFQVVLNRLEKARYALRSKSGRAGSMVELEAERESLMVRLKEAELRDARKEELRQRAEEAKENISKYDGILKRLKSEFSMAEQYAEAKRLDQEILTAERLETADKALDEIHQKLRTATGCADEAFLEKLRRARAQYAALETQDPVDDGNHAVKREAAAATLADLQAAQAQAEAQRDKMAAGLEKDPKRWRLPFGIGLVGAVLLTAVFTTLAVLVHPAFATGFIAALACIFLSARSYQKAAAQRTLRNAYDALCDQIKQRELAISQQESLCALFDAPAKKDREIQVAAARHALFASIEPWREVNTVADFDAAYAVLSATLRDYERLQIERATFASHEPSEPLEALRAKREGLVFPADYKADPIALQAEQEKATQALATAKAAFASVNTELETAFRGQPSVAQLERQIRQLTEEIARQKSFCDACEIAEATLEEAFGELRQSFGPQLNQRTSEILEELTKGAYTEAVVSRDLEVQAQPAGSFSLRATPYLSNGTADQLYLALRLAISDLISNPDDPPPLFLDDVLMQYDDSRAIAGMQFLQKYSAGRQVLLFTCHGALLQWAPQATVLSLSD